MAEEDNTIPPPPSGNVVMPKNIPPPPSGDVVMPDAQKKSEVVSGENSAQPTSVSTPPVSQPTTPSVESGGGNQQPTSEEYSEPKNLPESYQSDRLNYKDLISGEKYNLQRGGIPMVGVWNSNKNEFDIQPIYDVTQRKEKNIGFLEAVGVGLDPTNAPTETSEDALSRNAVVAEKTLEAISQGTSQLQTISQYPMMQRLAMLQNASDKKSQEEAKAIREKKIDVNEIPLIRLERDSEGRVLQNIKTDIPTEIYEGEVMPVDKFYYDENNRVKPVIPSIYKGAKTYGELFDMAKENASAIEAAKQQTDEFNKVLNQVRISDLPKEDQEYLTSLHQSNSPQYQEELIKTLERNSTTHNLLLSAGLGIAGTFENLTKVGSNLGLNDVQLADKKRQELMQNQLFATNPEGFAAEAAHMIATMATDMFLGGGGPGMLGIMFSKMPDQMLNAYYADQFAKGVEVPSSADAWKYVSAQMAVQVPALLLAGKIGGSAMNVVGKTTMARWGQLTKEIVKRAGTDAAVFGVYGSYAEKKVNDLFDVAGENDMLKMMAQYGFIGALFGLKEGLGKVGKTKLPKKIQSEIDFNFAKYVPKQFADAQIDALVKSGKMTEAEATAVRAELNFYRQIQAAMPNGLTFEQADKIEDLWRSRAEVKHLMENAEGEFKKVYSGMLNDIDRKILEKGGIPLTSEEKMELKKLSSDKKEGKSIDDVRLKYLENRQKSAEEVMAKEQPEKEKTVSDGKKLFSDPVPEIKKVAEQYKKKIGIAAKAAKKIIAINEDEAKERADAYELMLHDPNNPEVKASYEALVKETRDQAQALMDAGFKFEIYEGEGEPYKNSQEMLKDLRENKHLFILSTEKEFGQGKITDQQRLENPLLRDSGLKDINGKPLLNNDAFRGVHDKFGHGELGNSFGAVGEENAWNVHARMFTPLARRAMTTETRGQNSWVNYGKHLRNEDGTIKKVSAKEKPFAEQKVGLLPEKFSMLPEEMSRAGKEVKVENAPSGNHLNIGMQIYHTGKLMTEEQILNALPKDVEVLSYSVVEGTEPTLSIKTSRKLTDKEMSELLHDTNQQAIPQLTDGVGVLHDTMMDTESRYGDFNPEFFAKQNGDNLLAPSEEELTPAQKRLAETKEKQRTKVNAFEQKVIDDVNRALPSIARIVKKITGNDVSLKIHYDNGSWEKAVLESGGNLEDAKRAKGFYLSQDGSIHLNIREVESDTGLHEAFHPILDYIQANDPATIDELFGQLKGVKGAEEIVAKAERNYTGDVTIRKEAITDFIAKVADGQIRLDQTNLDKVKNFISNALKAVGLDGLAEKIAKDVGLDMTNAEDLRQLAKLISGKFKTGEEIRPEELSQESASKDIGPDQRASQTLQFSKTVYGESGFTKEPALDKDKYDKALRGGMPDGSPRIQIVNPKESLSGKKAMATFPDDHFVGELKYKGKTISEGNGGIFYTAKYGEKGGAWASVNETTAKSFAKNANESRKLNNGEGVILLVKGDNLKHQTSFESVSGFVNTLLTKAEDNGDFNQVLGVVKQLYGIHGNIKNAETVQKWFNQYLSGGRAESGQTMRDAKAHFDKMTTLLSKESNDAITKVFRDMGLEGERYYDKTQLKSGKYKVTKKGLENFFIDVFAEDALSGLEPGDVYGAIKFYSDLEVSPKDSKHPSYPFQIRTTDRSPVKLEIFDRAFKAYGENSALTGGESGSTASYGTASYTKPTLQIDPTKMPETPTRSEKIGQYESISRTQQPQFSKGDNIKDTYYEPHMTESKDKKDYVFFHVSEADRKSIERGIDSRKFHSTRTSREEKGLQYGVASFYTKPGDGERMVGGEKYAVHVPKDKVYPMDTDPNGYKAKAEAKIKEGTPFRSEKVKKAMADMAAKDGFQMAVGEWGYDRKGGETETPALRADALVPLKPQKEMAADYKPATTKEIPHPEREALIQQKAISDLAEEMYLEKPNAISEEIRMFGGIRTGEGDAVRPPTPAEFKEMTKELKGSLAKQAKAIEGKLAQGGPDTFERAADKKIRMAERNKILEEFGDKSEKAKFIFKNWDKIKDNLKSKAKELDITFAGDC